MLSVNSEPSVCLNRQVIAKWGKGIISSQCITALSVVLTEGGSTDTTYIDSNHIFVLLIQGTEQLQF